MNISDAHSFCLQLSEIVRQKNEVNFTKIFNPEELDDNEYNTLVTNLNSLDDEIIREIIDSFPNLELYDNFIMTYFNLIKNWDYNDNVKLFDLYRKLYIDYIQVFSYTWHILLLKSLSRSIVQLAYLCDLSPENIGGKKEKIEEAARLFGRMFNAIVNDREPLETSKKKSAYFITNLAFKTYFKIKNLHLCQSFIEKLKQYKLDEENFYKFPMSDQVTYSYYIGRLELFNSNFLNAEKHLNYAYINCPEEIECSKNKRLIFLYLTVVRLILGKFPREVLLKKYGYYEYFNDLIQAIKQGNFKIYNAILKERQDWYIKTEIYMILKKQLDSLMFRNLFSKVLGKKAKMMSYHSLLKAFKFAGIEDFDLDDVECVAISLIHKGYMKAFINNETQLIYLSKTKPFPNPYNS
ncbi:hypothetical protein H8356DRAFT_1632883 [Neocallimastix lanati (nom. inval.)]|uniref:PCI domain-containing protein n=1 Tax=Neocallimastix californiae TaxID=1754190 RepID=A0A1Y2BRS9_9FUNG|nr:hypothetical protein H8356DRAFT_1632883 [Neocallimastix sp. JGI-2020a]ORY37337.1 hypothetical protein LY90DRAFT_672852 [Neocallimastix californiae]|eukprot:ORY37337.1 hypothetical protein LY90DRAFT_672852 [Neocallimastix californiae]